MKKTDCNNFAWPSKSDNCWVSVDHILCKIETLQVKSHAARSYCVSTEEFDKILIIYQVTRYLK